MSTDTEYVGGCATASAGGGAGMQGGLQHQLLPDIAALSLLSQCPPHPVHHHGHHMAASQQHVPSLPPSQQNNAQNAPAGQHAGITTNGTTGKQLFHSTFIHTCSIKKKEYDLLNHPNLF